MHPAYSIILFTTASGAGYGLAALLGLGLLPAERTVGLLGYGLAAALIVIGLLSSTFHLRHPERAWRALSQWRSSWLSREGLLALVSFIPLAVLAFDAVVLEVRVPVVGVVFAVLAVLTVFATSMIYASLKTVGDWHTRSTPAVYFGFAFAGGAVLLAFVGFATGQGTQGQLLLAAAATLLAWAIQVVRWWRADGATTGETAESATGLGKWGKVRLLEPPHYGDNYLTREMGFKVARKHATKLRLLAIVSGLVVPLTLFVLAAVLAGGAAVAVVLGLAALFHLIGSLVTRWLFFAEARHTVSLYYGANAA